MVFPNGFGTVDELFGAPTLIQTGKILDFPIFLFGRDYRVGLLEWVRPAMVREGKAKEDDLNLLFVTDYPAEACDIIPASTEDPYDGGGYERRPRGYPKCPRRAPGYSGACIISPGV